MRKWLRPASLLLFAQMLMVGLYLGLTGRLEPVQVPDTQTYQEFAWESPEAILGDFRAPGYPAFLAVVSPRGNLSFVPLAHYTVYCLAVLIFAAALKRLGISEWPRMWTASAFLYANILHGYVMTVATDTLAAALAVASTGLLFLVLESRRYLAPLGLCVMAVWLVRPAYLSLVVQLPLLGIMIEMSRHDDRPSYSQLARTALLLAAITFLPLLVYCSLRATVVDRFGVVASGGLNLIGISGQFLEEEMIESLSEDLRPLARLGLARREALDDSDPFLMSDAPVLNYQRIENRYDPTIWKVFYPAAEETASSDAAVNTRLRQLAEEIIRRRPSMYAVYLVKAFRRAVFKIAGDTVLNPYCLLVCLLVVCVVVFWIVWARSPRATDAANHPDTERRPDATHVKSAAKRLDLLSLMTLTAVTFAAAQMAVVILVCPPLGRMTDAMALFVPSLLMAFLLDRVNRPSGEQ